MRDKLLQIQSLVAELLADLPPTTEQPPLTGATVLTTYEVVKEDTFLSEINEPVPTAEDLPEQTPDVPSLDGIANHIKEVIQQNGLADMMPQERFEKLCAYVIAGHKSGLEVSQTWVTETLVNQSLAITSDQESHLEQLRGIRREMLAKNMDLNAAQGQNGITENESLAFAALAEKYGLK